MVESAMILIEKSWCKTYSRHLLCILTRDNSLFFVSETALRPNLFVLIAAISQTALFVVALMVGWW